MQSKMCRFALLFAGVYTAVHLVNACFGVQGSVFRQKEVRGQAMPCDHFTRDMTP